MKNVFNRVQTLKSSDDCDKFSESSKLTSTRMTIPTLAFLLSLNISTSFAGECLEGECDIYNIISCTCNDNGKLIEAITGNGVNYKGIYTYDGAGNETSIIGYNSTEAIAEDKPDYKDVTTYDSAGYRISSIHYRSAEAIAEDKPEYKYIYTYDGAGNETFYVGYNSAEAIAEDKPYVKRLTTRDEDGNVYYIWFDTAGNITHYYDANWFYHGCVSEDCSHLDTTVVCAYGYTEGCVAGEVTLADGSKVMMKNGQVVGDEVDESSCYAKGQVFWNNACVDEYPFAKKRWTPAEANEWLYDGNDNFVVITFKK